MSADLGYAVVPYDHSEPLLALASELGRPVPARPGDSLSSILMPMISAESRPRSLSAAYGTGAFPFHTDAAHHRTPPSWVLLRVGPGGKPKVPTQVLQFGALEFSPSENDLLRSATFAVRGGPRSRFYRTIVDRGVIRFDPGCMRPVNDRGRAAVRVLLDAIDETSSINEVVPAVDEVIVIDNRSCLHARPPIEEHDMDRVLERVMVRAGEP